MKRLNPLALLTRSVDVINKWVAGVNWRQLSLKLKCSPSRRLPPVDLGAGRLLEFKVNVGPSSVVLTPATQLKSTVWYAARL